MCERCKRWLVFSKEGCGFSFKEARGEEYERSICKLEMVFEGEKKKKKMELDEKVNV